MKYSIKELATIAGVTVRTLHYYDEIGLLVPSQVRENGYRYYEMSSLLLLQQILFYRELAFPLSTIKEIMSSQHFDVHQALIDHAKNIIKEKNRYTKLAQTINITLSKLEKGETMTPQDLFGGLSAKQNKEYQAEAKTRWGNTDAYQESTRRVKAMGPAGLKKVTDAMKAVELELATHIGEDPASPAVQAIIQKHRANLNNFYDVSDEYYQNLAQMYIDDPRFAKHYNDAKPGLANFLSTAMLLSNQQ